MVARFLDLLPESKEKDVWKAKCTARIDKEYKTPQGGSEDSEEESLDWILDTIRDGADMSSTFSGKRAAAVKQVEDLTEEGKLDSYLESEEFQNLFGRYKEYNDDDF